MSKGVKILRMDYCANKIYKKPPEKKRKTTRKNTPEKKIAVGKTLFFIYLLLELSKTAHRIMMP